jgi:hypothetical protein
MMLSAAFLLAGVTLLAPPPPVNEADDAAHETMRRVAALTPPQQQAWLRELKARLDWANRLTLSPEDAAQQRQRVAELLKQKTVSFQTALELVRQRDAREKEAVTHLVERYRSQVFETFQGQGPAFSDRQEAWYRVWRLWEAAGSPTDQRHLLMLWLDGAIRNSRPGHVAALPADPTFPPLHPPKQHGGKKAMPPATEPGEATGKPIEGVKTLGKEAKKSDEPAKKPAESAKKPDEPEQKLAEPARKLAEPGDMPTEPEKKADQPSKKPAESEKADQPSKKPAEPEKKAAEPDEKSAQPEKKAADK